MTRSRLLSIAAALLTAIALTAVWWGWHHLDAAQLLLGSRLC
ncbi:MAG: hypothetical protein U5L98_11210 [Halomonas sp.]|nr:hypothetical protein [Halomonas sp.]MDZ7853183.1 hypothetical protein [Halomonas sp.]